MAGPPKKRLGELLIEAGVIDEHQLRSALGYQRQWGGKLGQALVALKLATEPQVVGALSRKLDFEVAYLDALQPSAELEAALKLVPRDVARKHNVLPLAADSSTLTVAVSDPTNLAVADEISFRAGRRLRIKIAGEREVARAVSRLYFQEENPAARQLELGPPSAAGDAREGETPEHLEWRLFRSALTDGSGGAFRAAETPPPAVAQRPGEELAQLLSALAGGRQAPGGVDAARLTAALAALLVRRGIFTESELLAELSRNRG